MIVYHAYHKEKPAFYIGKTIHSLDHRRKQHENESKYNRVGSIFHKALRKYGTDSFEWRVLTRCETVEELNAEEIRWIALVRETGHQLYNITEGGTGGDVGGSKYWKTHSPSKEMRKKISDGLKKYYATHTHANKGVTLKGTPHTDEAKEKMRLSKMGHEVSFETRIKLREANLGKKLQPHVIDILKEKFGGANNPSAKAIICITTGEVFEYAKLAATKYNVDLSSIIKCCRGKAKTAKGKVYKYYTLQDGI